MSTSYGWEEVPIYGLVRTIVSTGPNSTEPSISVLDLDFKPDLPPGALRGNPRKCAPFCNYCNVPKYFYLDQAKVCVQCDQAFTFSASEQKHWFEERQFHIRTKCLRCKRCRNKRQSERFLQRSLAEALKELESQPRNQLLNLVACQALVEHIAGTGRGDLQKCVTLARRAQSGNQDCPEAWYWEARAQDLAERANKAEQCLLEFLRQTEKATRLQSLRRDAFLRLEQLLKK